MTEVTLLSKKDLDGENFKIIGKKCKGTDFTECRGNMSYWTMSPSRFINNSSACVFLVTSTGELFGWYYVSNGYGVRPVLKSDNFNEIIKSQRPLKVGINIVTYGEYPQKKSKIQKELGIALRTREFNETGKDYTIPESKGGKEQQFTEYEYNGKKYIHKDNEWIEVTPIEWVVDEKNRRLVSKNILLNAPLNLYNTNYDGNFATSSLYSFLNTQFIKEIIPSNPQLQGEEEDILDDYDKEIARLKAEIAAKQGLISEYKKSRIELLTAENEALDSELAALGIDPNKGTAYTIKPQSQNSKVTSSEQ